MSNNSDKMTAVTKREIRRVTNPYIESANGPISGPPVSKTPTLQSMTLVDKEEALIKKVVADAKAKRSNSGMYVRVSIPRDE